MTWGVCRKMELGEYCDLISRCRCRVHTAENRRGFQHRAIAPARGKGWFNFGITGAVHRKTRKNKPQFLRPKKTVTKRSCVSFRVKFFLLFSKLKSECPKKGLHAPGHNNRAGSCGKETTANDEGHPTRGQSRCPETVPQLTVLWGASNILASLPPALTGLKSAYSLFYILVNRNILK